MRCSHISKIHIFKTETTGVVLEVAAMGEMA